MEERNNCIFSFESEIETNMVPICLKYQTQKKLENSELEKYRLIEAAPKLIKKGIKLLLSSMAY